MDEPKTTVVRTHYDAERGSYRTYVIGFVLSIIFTLLAYLTVIKQTFRGNGLIATLLGLAVVQFVVQLYFFLHVGRETKPRWKTLTLFLMLVFVLIVVLGSIWVMYSLNYRMSPNQINQYMVNQADGGL